MGADHLGDGFAAFELDWLLALEVSKKLGYKHRSLKCAIKCWHGMDDSITPLGSAMWMQREMDHFLLYAVEGATHNIHLDFSITKALFADICAEVMASKTAALASEQEKEVEPSAGETTPDTVQSTETVVDQAQSSLPTPENIWS